MHFLPFALWQSVDFALFTLTHNSDAAQRDPAWISWISVGFAVTAALFCFSLSQSSEWLATSFIWLNRLWQCQSCITLSALFSFRFLTSSNPTISSFGELQDQFRWENVLMGSHDALIYSETLARSLCTLGSLILSAAGVCRECRRFGPAQHSTHKKKKKTQSNCEICTNSSVGSGSLFELGTS